MVCTRPDSSNAIWMTLCSVIHGLDGPQDSCFSLMEYQTLGLRVATGEGVPIRRWTSSRLWVLTSSLSTAPGDGENPRMSVGLSQAASRRAASATVASGTVRRMDGFLGSLERGCTRCRDGRLGSTGTLGKRKQNRVPSQEAR